MYYRNVTNITIWFMDLSIPWLKLCWMKGNHRENLGCDLTFHNQSFLWQYSFGHYQLAVNLLSSSSFHNFSGIWCSWPLGIIFFSQLPCHLTLPVFSFGANCYLIAILLPVLPLVRLLYFEVIQSLGPNSYFSGYTLRSWVILFSLLALNTT